MPLETTTTISGLNASNPTPSDGLVQGDDHIRLLKAVLLNCLPNIGGPTTISHTQINDLAAGLLKAAAGSAGAPSLTFGPDTASGLYRLRAGRVGVSGTLRGPIGITGQIVTFPKLPPAGAGVLVCDGTKYLGSDYPELGAYLGLDTDGKFTVPDYKDVYLRGHGGVWDPGTFVDHQVGPHGHTASATCASAGAHAHNVYLYDPGHDHGYEKSVDGVTYWGNNVITLQATRTNARTDGNTTGITIHNGAGVQNATASAGAHQHGVEVTVAATTTSETRPRSRVVVYCIVT